MLEIVRSEDRHHVQAGWLDARWHFSFDHYHDPDNMGFGNLRVFNHDVVQPGQGFPMHPHRDMEIVTYIIRGAVEHRDSTGGHGVIQAGEVQRMSAGSGVRHSEINHSTKEPVELLQMWVFPEKRGVQPSYEQKRFSTEERTGKLLPIVSPEMENGALFIGTDATFLVSRVEPGQTVERELGVGRRAYVFVIDGAPTLNGEKLNKNDSVKATDVDKLTFTAGKEAAELLVIDLP